MFKINFIRLYCQLNTYYLFYLQVVPYLSLLYRAQVLIYFLYLISYIFTKAHPCLYLHFLLGKAQDAKATQFASKYSIFEAKCFHIQKQQISIFWKAENNKGTFSQASLCVDVTSMMYQVHLDATMSTYLYILTC